MEARCHAARPFISDGAQRCCQRVVARPFPIGDLQRNVELGVIPLNPANSRCLCGNVVPCCCCLCHPCCPIHYTLIPIHPPPPSLHNTNVRNDHGDPCPPRIIASRSRGFVTNWEQRTDQFS